ncbi:MAG: hypothetical protein HC904_14425 [Blastochloris sp.]|nr:hypothetical protein [Blastochloris sp.]
MITADNAASVQETAKVDHFSTVRTGQERSRSVFQAPPKTEYTLKKRFVAIEGGRFLLHLRDGLRISLEVANFECEVIGWGIKLPQAKVGEIDRLLERQFLSMFSKADAQKLTPEEKATWLSILDQVDYEAFCFDRAAPRYLEGTLLHKGPNWQVEWLDGTKEKLSPYIAVSLGFLDSGEQFGAYVHLDKNTKTRAIERVLPLPAV